MSRAKTAHRIRRQKNARTGDQVAFRKAIRRLAQGIVDQWTRRMVRAIVASLGKSANIFSGATGGSSTLTAEQLLQRGPKP